MNNEINRKKLIAMVAELYDNYAPESEEFEDELIWLCRYWNINADQVSEVANQLGYHNA